MQCSYIGMETMLKARTLYESITKLPSRLHSILCKIQNNYITFDIVKIKGQTYKTNVTKATIMKRSVNGNMKYA